MSDYASRIAQAQAQGQVPSQTTLQQQNSPAALQQAQGQAMSSKVSPLLAQWGDPQFRALSYEEQQKERVGLFLSIAQKSPTWQTTSDDQKLSVLNMIKDQYPPAFTDPKFELYRRQLDDPKTNAVELQRFLFSMDTQFGLTGILARGVVNTSKALTSVTDRVGQFFGAKPGVVPTNQVDTTELMMRSISGDKDGVKLATYLQKKYEKPINSAIPLIGGQTPTQLLGSALGFGIDLLSTKGVSGPAEVAAKAATATAAPLTQTLVGLGARAATTGTLGLGRGVVAEGVNAVKPNVAPLAGATDTAHGIVASLQSIGTLWGVWAAQDLAFGMLGEATKPVANVARVWGQSILGKGTAGLPKMAAFEQMADGSYTPRALAAQRQFTSSIVGPAAQGDLSAIGADWIQGLRETTDAIKADPNVMLKDPVMATRIGAQLMMGDRNAGLGMTMIQDGPGTFRVRQAMGKGGEVLGEHLSFNEAEMVIHNEWENEIQAADDRLSEWNPRYEKTKNDAALRQVQSAMLHKEGLISLPHDRAIQDAITLIEGNMDRFAPEGAAKLPSQGAMLTYGEVGQIQGVGMKVAKTQLSIPESTLADVAKRGEVVNSDKPTRFTPASSGDYNGAIVYSRAAPDPVYQAALAKAKEFIANGANATQEELANWLLRDRDFDAIEHSNGDVTSLYPRQQVKAVSDFVDKSSRDFTKPETAPAVSESSASTLGLAPSDIATTYKAPSMLSAMTDKADWLMEAAGRENNTRIIKLPTGDYQLHMFGANPIQGTLDEVTDAFLLQSTTRSHLQASLDADGMSLKVKDGQYSIVGKDGKTLGSGASLSEVMVNSHYRPRLIDGRFGPANVEVLPPGAAFEYSPQGVRGSLADVYKYTNSFMDVAGEEGKSTILRTDSGGVTLGHDGAYTVEIPSWGIREKFASASEAKDYLNGHYQDYGNIQKLANERGFSFTYDPNRGYVLANATGTYAIHSMDDVGKVLNSVPDPRWAPGGQFEAGVTLKNSSDAIKMPSDAEPNYLSDGKTFNDRNAIGQSVSQKKTTISAEYLQIRATLSRLEKVNGTSGQSAKLASLQNAVKLMANQDYVDYMKSRSISSNYNLSDKDWMAVEKVRAALGDEKRQTILSDLGYEEGNAKRPQILDAADRLRKEFYNPLFQRSGQDPNMFLVDFAMKKFEFKQKNPEAYSEMEAQGPAGMRRLINTLYKDRVPDELRFQSLNERISDSDNILNEENALKKANAYAHMTNKWFYVSGPLKAFADSINENGVPDSMRIVGQHYIDQMLNEGLSDTEKLLGALREEGPKPGSRGAIANTKTLLSASILSRPGSARHVIQQSYINGSAYLGTEAMSQGVSVSSAGGVDHALDLFNKGVFTGRNPASFSFGDLSSVGSGISKIISKVGQAATFFLQNAHIKSKVMVYDAASWLFDRHIQPWVDSGKVTTWDSKLHDIRGYHLDPGIADKVKSQLDAGNYDGAKNTYAQNMTDKITYQWRPEDQGFMFNSGMLAKTWGQFGIAPSGYVAAIKDILSNGSFADRIQNSATFAKNTALIFAANKAAGFSTSNLLPWTAISLRGAPIWQELTTLTSNQSGKQKLDATLKAAQNLLPGKAALTQATQAIKDLASGNPLQSILTLLK